MPHGGRVGGGFWHCRSGGRYGRSGGFWHCRVAAGTDAAEGFGIAVATAKFAEGFAISSRCPRCGSTRGGVLGPLIQRIQKKTNRHGWFHRCGKFGCQYYIVPHTGSPLFSHGRRITTLRGQVRILYLLLSGATFATTCIVTGENHKVVSKFSRQLDRCRRMC